jgi:hypothetical protein
MLSIIEAFKEFNRILLRYPYIGFTNHKNTTSHISRITVCDKHWLLLLDEYSATFDNLPGKKIFLRIDFGDLTTEEEALSLLSELENCNPNLLVQTALTFTEQGRVEEW